jgi:tetratricopeptide (TPR) repeat protein
MIQRADVRGQGNVTVQIVGEHNEVTVAGAAELRLTMYPRRRREGGETGLLSPYTQSIELVGREPQLAELKAWLATERDIAIQVRTGKAGAGKTRLAFDLCDELQGRDWQAGFVNGDHLSNLVADADARWGCDLPTLAVVDYAAQWADPLRRWFSQLVDLAPTDAPPLRILLLERQAEVESGWMQAALGTGTSQERAVLEMLDPGTPVPISGLAAREHRRAVLDQMLAKLESPVRTPAVGTDPDFDRRLAELTWGGEPLFLMMAALLAAETSLPEVLELPRTEIAHKVAKREIGRIRGLARERGLAPNLLVHMAAYVTLSQGLAREALLDAIEAEAAQLRLGVGTGAATVADTLADALPGTPVVFEPIRPDALAEAVVLQAFGDARISGAAVVARAYGQAGTSVAGFVIRTAQDFTAAGYEQPLAWLDTLIGRGSVAVDQLMLLADTLPESSFALMEHAARLTQKIAVLLRDAVAAGEAHRLPVLATALNNLGVRLSEVGQRQEALGPAQEAVAIGRELAAKAPNAYRTALASALNDLANRLGEVGQRQEALGPAQEAVDMYRELAAKAPDAYRPDLAMALNNLANRLSDVGQRQEALWPAQEAVAIRRELAARAPDAYRPALATALNNLANHLSGIGQRQEALRPAQEAVDMYRELAANAPDAYRPALAGSLASLANCWEETGDLEEAITSNREAIELYRAHFVAQPPAFVQWMVPMCQQYIERCGKIGQEPNAELLTPILEVLQQMQEESFLRPDGNGTDA